MGDTNLFDYLTWRGDISMEEVEFGKIDGMILSRFAYVPFDIIFSETNPQANQKGIKLGAACDLMVSHPDIKNRVIYDQDILLMERLSQSRRFKSLTISNFVNIVDVETETQFSCFSLNIDKEVNAIVFRGTDDTIIGWKEDLNMGFVNPITAQIHATDYVNTHLPEMKGKIILAGHSKGGNIASYAAAFCQKNLRDRIMAVYNYDGPGFMEEVLNTEGFKEMAIKIHTYVPQSSLVGMLLGHKEKHRIIHSMEFGPMQHNLYSWEVLGNDFIEEENTTKESQYFDTSLKDWLSKMSQDQREKFVEGGYSLIANMDAKTLSDVKDNWFENSKSAIQAMKNMDNETKKIVSDGIKLFLKCYANTVKDGFNEEIK